MIKFQNISKVLFVYVYPLVDTSKFQIIKSTELNIFFFLLAKNQAGFQCPH